MKKIITIVVFTIMSGCASADGYYNHHYYQGSNQNSWVVPLIGGVVIGTFVGNAYRQPQPVYPPTMVYPPQYQGVPYGYHYESIYDGYLGGYRTIIAPN